MRRVILIAVLVSLVGGVHNFFIQSPLSLNLDSPSFSVDETFFYASKVVNPLNNSGELVPAGLMWLLTKLTNSTVTSFAVADFIFPAFAFLMLYLLTRSITVSLSTLISYHYLTYFPYLPSVIKLWLNYWQNGSYWPLIRAFHPQISLGLWFVFVKWPNWLTLTLLTYTDPFYWTAAFAWLVLKRYLKPLVFWVVAALPYWYSVTRLFPAADYWQRNYYFVPPTINQLLVLAFGLALALWQKRWRGFYLGITALTAVVTIFKFGADDPIGHWFLRVVNPMTAVLIFSLLFNKLKWSKITLIITSFFLLFFQFRLHFQYFKNNAAAFALEPERLEVFTWLKQNTPKNSIVATTMKDSLYLPAYTKNQPYLKQAQLSEVTNDELIHRFLQVYKRAGYTDEQLISLFQDNPALIAKKRFDFDNCAGHFLFFRLYNQGDYYNCDVPDQVLREILNQYEQTLMQLTYPADYWLGTNYIDFGQLLWENQAYKVYALH